MFLPGVMKRRLIRSKSKTDDSRVKIESVMTLSLNELPAMTNYCKMYKIVGNI